MKILPRSAKPKFDAYQDAPLAVHKNHAVVCIDSSDSTVLDQRKKQAEEPIYLNRM